MKKGITVLAVLVAVLAVTSGGFAAVNHYVITSSGQIKDGAVSASDLSSAARQALKGQKGNTGVAGANGAQGPAGAQGLTGARGATGSQGSKGDTGPQGPKGDTGPQGPQGVPGTPGSKLLRLAGDFRASNASVATTLDGVQFGPFAAGGSAGGSMVYNGVNGMKLADIKQLSYTVMHSTADDNAIGSPYLRIFLDGHNHDVIFDATQCARVVPTEDEFHSYEVTTGDVRYDDDSCDGVGPGQQTWASVVAAHGNEVVSGIYVTTGYTGGGNLSALLRTLSVNGTSFTFGAS